MGLLVFRAGFEVFRSRPFCKKTKGLFPFFVVVCFRLVSSAFLLRRMGEGDGNMVHLARICRQAAIAPGEFAMRPACSLRERRNADRVICGRDRDGFERLRRKGPYGYCRRMHAGIAS